MAQTGIKKRVAELAKGEAITVVRNYMASRVAQPINQFSTGGTIDTVNGADVTVRMDTGELKTSQLTGNTYVDVGSKVNVLGNQVI